MIFADEDAHFVAAYDNGGEECWARLAWQQSMPGAVGATPVEVGSALAVLTEEGLVMLLDQATGELRGRIVNHRGGKDVGGLAYETGKLCVAHGRHVTCYAMPTEDDV